MCVFFWWSVEEKCSVVGLVWADNVESDLEIRIGKRIEVSIEKLILGNKWN